MQIDELRSRLVACVEKFDKTPRYAAPDRVLGTIFRRHPNNDDLETVLLKVTLLDRLYNTQIYGLDGLYRMAVHIRGKDLDVRLNGGQADAVDIIRRGHGLRGGADYFSFATKYCHWHRPDIFPMYDSNVDTAIHWLSTRLGLGPVPIERLREFVFLKGLMDTCRNRLELDWPGYKRFDQALWILGQELKDKSASPDSRM